MEFHVAPGGWVSLVLVVVLTLGTLLILSRIVNRIRIRPGRRIAVFSTRDKKDLAAAESMLEDAKIEYLVKIIRPMEKWRWDWDKLLQKKKRTEIWIDKENAEQAKALLSGIKSIL